MNYCPFFLNSSKLSKVTIIGGGEIALAKLEFLLHCYHENQITIIAKNIHDNFYKVENLNIIQDAYQEKYLKNSSIVIVATNNKDLNQIIYNDAKKLNILVNVVDQPNLCDFIFPAIIQRGKLQIAISTSGVSPVLARLLKQTIEKIIPISYNNLIEFLKDNTQKVRNKITQIQPRRLFWEKVINSNIGNKALSGELKSANQDLEQLLNNSTDKLKGVVHFISAGPGDPELFTIKGVRYLSQADIVLYDRLVAPTILDFARKDAVKIFVGKTKNHHVFKQDEINKMLIEYCKQGKIVARLKGGDSTIFAHLFEEIQSLQEHQLDFTVTAGISAAQAIAASLNISLTQRNKITTIKFTTFNSKFVDNKYWQNIAQGNDSIAFYMCTSNIKLIIDKLIEFGKDPNTKIAIIEQGATPYQQEYIANLNNFCYKFNDIDFISPTLIMVGDILNDVTNLNYNIKRKKFFKEI